MAVDDSISDWGIQVLPNATVSIQPASGVEWMITEVQVKSSGASNLNWWGLIADTLALSGAYFPGSTSFDSDFNVGTYHQVSRRYFITNAEYPRIDSDDGTNNQGFIYNGIQIK